MANDTTKNEKGRNPIQEAAAIQEEGYKAHNAKPSKEAKDPATTGDTK